MKPFYQDGSATIYHGDCRNYISGSPDFDILLTDPPYGMNYQSNWNKNKLKKINNDKSLPVELINQFVERALASALVFCRWDNLYELPKPKSFIAWVKDKHTSGDLKRAYGRQWEGIAYYPKCDEPFLRRPSDVYRAGIVRYDHYQHPTEKPVQLLTALLRDLKGKTVLDPFMGSGTTLQACKLLGLKCIGIETDLEYCKVAVKKLAQESIFKTVNYK